MITTKLTNMYNWMYFKGIYSIIFKSFQSVLVTYSEQVLWYIQGWFIKVTDSALYKIIHKLKTTTFAWKWIITASSKIISSFFYLNKPTTLGWYIISKRWLFKLDFVKTIFFIISQTLMPYIVCLVCISPYCTSVHHHNCRLFAGSMYRMCLWHTVNKHTVTFPLLRCYWEFLGEQLEYRPTNTTIAIPGSSWENY